MSWTIPKTNWTGSEDEWFDVLVDYPRIKNNILYLKDLFESTFNTIDDPFYPMKEYNYGSIPYVDFFNNIVYNLDTLRNNLKKAGIDLKDYNYLRIYYENQSIWDYNDLNKIEENTQLIKDAMKKYENAKVRLPIRLGSKDNL